MPGCEGLPSWCSGAVAGSQGPVVGTPGAGKLLLVRSFPGKVGRSAAKCTQKLENPLPEDSLAGSTERGRGARQAGPPTRGLRAHAPPGGRSRSPSAHRAPLWRGAAQPGPGGAARLRGHRCDGGRTGTSGRPASGDTGGGSGVGCRGVYGPRRSRPNTRVQTSRSGCAAACGQSSNWCTVTRQAVSCARSGTPAPARPV